MAYRYTTFIRSLVILTIACYGYGEIYQTQYYPNAPPPREVPVQSTVKDAVYDFIIVGAGSSGSVIANRLSEIGSWNILLLEAGFRENSLAEFATMATLLQFTDYNWGYTTEPEPHSCLAMDEQRCAWPRGKALGGSSVINYMVYSRGNPEDYDRWAALGNPGWSYADVLPYFLKSEDSHLNNSNEAFHNKGGFLSIANPFISELGHAFISAGLELGYENIDYNAPEQQLGFSRLQSNIKQGRRYSVGKAFLEPVLHRQNLKVVAGAEVTKILIDPSSKRAFGVEYTWRNQKMIARSTKEVILSAGALNSPKVLMLSGIGPKSHLDELGIPTLSDLPVGQTLYNHIAFSGLIINYNLTTDSEDDFYPLQLLQLFTTGDGPLSSTAGNEAIAFIKTDASQEEGYPDVELLLIAGSIRSDDGKIERKALRITDHYFSKMYATSDTTPTFTIIPVLLHPKSRGFMKLKSSNPHDHPLFYANAFTDPENCDMRSLIASIRFIIQLCETQPFRKYNARVDPKPFVGCEHLPFNSDEYWECVLQLLAIPAHHQTSTCKMGPSGDHTAVVSPQLKVYGIGNLRVADTSVIPIPLSGHTNAPAVMVGEIASDIIKNEWEIIQKSYQG